MCTCASPSVYLFRISYFIFLIVFCFVHAVDSFSSLELILKRTLSRSTFQGRVPVASFPCTSKSLFFKWYFSTFCVCSGNEMSNSPSNATFLENNFEFLHLLLSFEFLASSCELGLFHLVWMPSSIHAYKIFWCPCPHAMRTFFFFQVRKHCRHCGKYRMNASKLELYNYCPKKCPVPVPRMCPSNFSIFISLNPSNFLPIFVVRMMAPLSWTHAFSFPFHVQSPRNVHGLKFPFEVFTDQGYNNIIVRMLFLLMTEKSRFNQFHFLEFYEMFSITKKNPVPNF